MTSTARMPSVPNPRSSAAKRSWGGGDFEFAVPAASLISPAPFGPMLSHTSAGHSRHAIPEARERANLTTLRHSADIQLSHEADLFRGVIRKSHTRTMLDQTRFHATLR